MNKICDNCETAIHCAKYGCIPERIGSKPAQEFICSTGLCHFKAQRPWVGLTDEEWQQIQRDNFQADQHKAIEAKLKEKNT